MPLNINVTNDNPSKGAVLVQLDGSLDSLTSSQLETALAPVLQSDCTLLVMDMANLKFLSSAGIRVLLRSQKELSSRKASFALSNLQPQIAKVMQIVKALPGMSVFTSVAELDAYCARLGLPALREFPPLHHLAASGLVRLQRGEAVALVDVAPVGPDYLPGHAHADTLSFELSLGAQRVLVNSGTSCYGTSAERLRQRGTAAHNTVIVDGHDSSEVWGGFRVARRARPTVPQLQANGVLDVRCAHDGYTRLPGAPVHERRWLLEEGSLRVIDTVSGRFGTAEARFHFHPDVTLGCGDGPARRSLHCG